MSFNRNDPNDLLALKNEVNNDPAGVGYNPITNTDVLVSQLNDKTTGGIVSKPKISAADVRTNTTYDAFEGLLGPEENWLQWITGSNGFQEENLTVTADLRQKLAGDPVVSNSIWASADRVAMNAAMLALIDVPGSRAEVLFGYGTVLRKEDWIAARDS